MRILRPTAAARRAVVASTTTVAVLGTAFLAAGPAAAIPVQEVPEDPAAWASTPYSPLAADALAAERPVDLTFDGEGTGLPDGSDRPTGFTVVLPSSADPRYFLPEQLTVADGSLTVVATPGTATGPAAEGTAANQQDNALGVAVDATTPFTVSTTIAAPDVAVDGRAGLWLGPDDDHLLQLALTGSRDGGAIVQLTTETAGAVGDEAASAAVDVPQDTNVVLSLTVDPAAGTATGVARVGDGAPQEIGTLAVPAALLDGTALATAVPAATTLTGLFTSAGAEAVAYTFEDLSVTDADLAAPDAPTGVEATLTGTQVQVSWDFAPASADVVGYRVYRGATSPVSTAGDGLGGADLVVADNFVDPDVVAGESYVYAVVAVDGDGATSPATEASVTLPAPVEPSEEPTEEPTGEPTEEPTGEPTEQPTDGPAAPAAPADLSAEATEAGVVLSWAPAEHATGYEVRRTTGEETTTLTETDATAFVDATAEPGQTYAYTVLAVGEGGTSEPSEALEITVPDPDAPPAAPTGLTGEPGAGGVALTWEAVEYADGYEVRRTAGEETTTLTEDLLTETAFTDATAEPGQSYAYTVVAVNAAGASAPSAALEVTVPVPPPSAPAGLSATLGEDGVALTWEPVEGATGYSLYRGLDQPAAAAGEPLATLTGTTYLDADIAEGTSYSYVVVAVGEGGASEPSEAAEVTVPEPQPTPEFFGPRALAAPEPMLAPAPICPAGQWAADYFTGTTLAGAPTRSECVPAVDLNWFHGSPADLPADGFSARFTTTIDEGAGTYQFQATSDDGVRVLVDGKVVIDRWHPADGTELYAGEVELADGPHQVVVEYYEADGGSQVHVDWVKDAAARPGEWLAEYYTGTDLAGSPAALADLDELTLDWGHGGPAGLPTNDFSARFSTVLDDGAGTYEFLARADDGVRVYVDGETVIDEWHPSGGTDVYTGQVDLTDGPHDVVVEYYEASGGALVEVSWVKDATTPTGQWLAEYFAGTDLGGAPVSRTHIDDVSLDWGHGSPAGVPTDDFSARFSTVLNEGAGPYTFQAVSDDGVRVYVDGEAVIDEWHSSGATDTYVGQMTLTDGAHEVVVEYYEASGAAEVHVGWTKSGTTPGPDPEPGPVSRWLAQYYNGTTLSGAAVSSSYLEELDLDWGHGSPAGLPTNEFSARFATTLNEGAGTYEFTASSDDGVRVFVDDALVIDEWRPADGSELYTGTVQLGDGAHEVVVEYYEASGAAEVQVGWTRTAGEVDTTPPAAPTALSAEVKAGTIDLAWSESVSVDAVGYHVYRGTAPGVQPTGVPYSGAAALTSPSFSDTDATADVTYYYVVTAVDAAGNESPVSAEVSATRLSVAPPADLLATGGPDGIQLTWEASPSQGVTGYHVYRATAPGVSPTGTPLTGAAPVVGTTYTDTTAEEETPYYYVVVAVADEQVSPPSNEAQGVRPTGADSEAPAVPADLVAQEGDAQVTLTWVASTSTDVVGYRLYRSLDPGELVESEPIGGGLITATGYTDTGLSNGTTYFYGVTAVDGAGNESVMSNTVHAVPRVPNDLEIKVDFTTQTGDVAPGYLHDYGQAYGQRSGTNQGTDLNYGWTTPDGNPVSLVGNARDRGRTGVDPRLDSIIHMQYGDTGGTNGVPTEGSWEISVPNGVYEVTVALGDGPEHNSSHVINVEAGLGIEAFVPTAAEEYRTATVTVGVWDGRLTLNPIGGTNTKIAYVELRGMPMAPHVDTVLPENRAVGHDINAGVSATIRIPYAGVGVDPTTLDNNVLIYEVATGDLVNSSVGSSGGNDVISVSSDDLEPLTTYRFVVTDRVKDNYGAAFLPFNSVFTTGTGEVTGGEQFDPLTGIGFEKVEQPVGAGLYWASFAFGPDGKLYGTTIGQGLYRMDVAADGTLSNLQNLGYQGRAMIGLVFDRDATADNLRLWVTSTSANVVNEQEEWISGISLLTGPDLGTEHKVFEHLPRALADHLTNSITYGPDGRLYFLQGSNQAAGDLDNSWGQRGEKLLTAATLVFDQDHPQVQAVMNGAGPISVKTSDGGTYDPFAPDAPLRIYATGIRNAYDLVWHSNGKLYVPTNGTAGGANSPGVQVNADGTFTRLAADGIPGYSSVHGQDITEACQNRRPDGQPYDGGDVPPIANHPTQRDFLFMVEAGGYYGHPNPERCEFVLNEGNDPNNPPVSAGAGGTEYPLGVQPDPNYRGIAYDLEFNKSPNGVIEYQGDAFGGQLKGRLVVTRFSNNNDLLFLQVEEESGEVLGAQSAVGITGVAGSTIDGVSGFNDPLEVVEHPTTGNLYVNQYDRAGGDQKLFLLRVPEDQAAQPVETSSEELIFSAVKQTTSPAKTVAVTNTGNETVTLTPAVTGTHAAEFALASTEPITLAPGGSADVAVTFAPGATAGQREAVLTLTGAGATLEVGLYGLSLAGIEGDFEPPFQDVLGTLGHKVNVGWTTLASSMSATPKGEEVLEPKFVKAGTTPVTMTPLSHFAPKENIPFGWYTGDGTEGERHVVGQIDISGYQTLLPPVTSGGSTTFDPGTAIFGLFYYSANFGRHGFTEDRLNTEPVGSHRARVYPAKDRSSAAMANSYIVAFEDASNGDYQDYVFLVSGIRPAGQQPPPDEPPAEDGIYVNFSNASAQLPAGYLRDHGQPYGVRTGADQGGLTYGWRNEVGGAPIDLATGGTQGNGRDRATSQPDQRLDTLMHMQAADIVEGGSAFNGTPARAYWELALPTGTYEVTVAVGDPTVNADVEKHVLNLEGEPFLPSFTPTGPTGSSTRHKVVTGEVSVTDGFLTVDAKGGTNTKINYIDVVPVEGADDPSDGADVKVNFQTAGAPTPGGWTTDTGAAFDAGRGYGWSVGATPTDRTAFTRYRAAATAGIAYPADVRLQSHAMMQNGSTNATWEYALANGTYEVALAVGDPAYLDSVHTVQAEGQVVINGFVPTGATPFQTGVRTVEVTDGRLTLTATGTNTKIAWVSIDGAGTEEPPPPPEDDTETTLEVDFGPASAPIDAGWVREEGTAYSAARGYGWLDDDSGEPVARTTATRYRAAATSGIAYPTQTAQKSFAVLDDGNLGYTNGRWELAVAPGSYDVELSVGDAAYLDSVHGVDVEGTPVITGFQPTGTTPFFTASGTVTVTDGRLTVTDGGSNTKINWIRVTGVNLDEPAVDVTVGGVSVGETHAGGPAEIALAATAKEGATIATLTYTVDGGAVTAYTAPFTLEPGSHTVTVTATDSTGRSTVREVDLTVFDSGGTLSLYNEQVSRVDGAPIPGTAEDWVVLHRINSGYSTHEVTDEATVQLRNTGTEDLHVTGLSLTGTDASAFVLTAPVAPFTVPPGEARSVALKFVGTSGSAGVRSAQVVIASSDPERPTTVIQVRGGFMTQPEGAAELTLGQVVSLFGWSANIGSPKDGAARTSPLDGDEVRSTHWQRLDPSKPVVARQLAALHGCCTSTETLDVSGATTTHHGTYGQTLLPLDAALTGPAELSVDPSGTFPIKVTQGLSTASSDYVPLKTWPVLDQAGRAVPGAWIVGQDYVYGPTCGTGPTNCDYQDNVYLVTNVVPVTPHDTTAPAAPTDLTGQAEGGTAVLSWSAGERDVAGYHVERATSPDGPWTRLTGTTPVAGPAYTDGAPPPTGYYRVLAVDISGRVSAPTTPLEVKQP